MVTIRFASYNIHKAVGTDGRRDGERIIAVLREINADIIALQEADRRLGDRASVLSRAGLDDTQWRPLDVAVRPRSLGWHGNALLVRRDIECVDSGPMHLPVMEPRGAVRAILDVGGQKICIIGAHLDLSGLRRRDQIRAILNQREDDAGQIPFVLMGDFNQWTRRGAMREFDEGWHVITPGSSFPSRRPIATLDRIVASQEWHILDHGVHHSALAVQASDHLPVWAELGLPSI
ncbi:MAG: endonuclease/exonuclease/phosphatase family protein [Sphingomonadaceae bacterium]